MRGAILNFAEKLQLSSNENKSMLCVGLDPDLAFLRPNHVAEVVEFNRMLIEATADLACAYKPNLAIYDALRAEDVEALKPTLRAIRDIAPDIPIIGDIKRADIDICGREYARTMFDIYGFDAVTVYGYMGDDALDPFLRHADKGVFILCRTSNPGGQKYQEVMVVRQPDSTPEPYYLYLASLIRDLNTNGNVGLVVGATYPEQITKVRQICPDMLLLIPGVGAQGGDIAATVRSAADKNGSGFLINVSRQIMYAAKSPEGELRIDDEARRNVREEALRIRSEINQHLPATVSSN